MARSSIPVADNDWSFGQILTALLLLGPVVTCTEIAFDPEIVKQRRNPAIADETEINGSIEHDDHVNYLNQIGESLETSQLSQCVTACVNRDYYDDKTCSWILYALCLLCFQIVLTSVMVFSGLTSKDTPVQTIMNLGTRIFVAFPSTNYLFILICTIYENHFPRKGQHWVYVGMMGVVLGLCFAFWFLPSTLYGQVSLPMGVFILAFSAPLPLLWY